GTLVSWLTGTASSLTLRRFAYSLASSHAGPLHGSPWPVVFSTSHGALASTPTRSTPAFLIASMRGLAPGAGVATSAAAVRARASTAMATVMQRLRFMFSPGTWPRPARPFCGHCSGIRLLARAAPLVDKSMYLFD